MNYNDYVQQISTMAVVPSDDPNFTIIIPQMINYAELRIQRDLDLFAGQTVNTFYSTQAGIETVDIQDSDFITIQGVSVGTSPSTPLLPVTKEWLQYVYPSGSTSGVPKYFAMYTSSTTSSQGGGANINGLPTISIRLGPIPSTTYSLSITGTLHTKPMNSTNNTETWISTYLPDLFIMASMIYVSAYQRNFGRLNDDPQMAQTYESQYQALLNGARTEEFRKKFQASGWTSMSPSPVATPTR